MIIRLTNFIYKFLFFSLFFLPIQAVLVFLFHFPNSIQYFYFFLIIGVPLCLCFPLKYIRKSIDKNFVILFLFFLLSLFISLIVNYEQVMSRGMDFTYYTLEYSKFWDRPDIRMFNWGVLRPFLFFIFACILFLFMNLKYGVKIALKAIIYLAIISSVYSIYQIIAGFFHLPFGAVFSGHNGKEIYLFGNLRRVEGLFYEPGPHATFLAPVFCIMFFQLFEKNKERLLLSKNNTYLVFILVTTASICTFSPIAFLAIPICIGLSYILKIRSINFKMTPKKLKYILVFSITLLVLLFCIGTMIKSNAKNFSISKYMIEKILVSTTSFDSPIVYLNPDSRSVRAYVGMSLFKDNPLFGAGPSSSIAYFFKYATFTTSGIFLRDQHAVINTHIKMLCEFGIIGFFIYLLLLLYPIYLYVKRTKLLGKDKNLIDSLLVAYIIYILVSFQATIQIWMPYFWMIYVLLVVILNKHSKVSNNIDNAISYNL